MRIFNFIKKHIKKNKKGFTLIELIVNMAIIGIIMAMVTTLTGNTINMFNKKKDKMDAIAVADIVSNALENQIRLANAVKLENEFEEKKVLNVIQDQTNDGKEDYLVSRISKHPKAKQYFFDFPICLAEIQNYSSIFILPRDGSQTRHSERKKLTGAERSGKLYMIDRIKDAKETPQTTDHGTKYYELTDALGQEIKIYPLLAEEYYKNYTVDVDFEYLLTNTKEDASYKPDTNRINSIKVYIYVYDGDKLAFSKENTITFSQLNFQIDKPRNSAKLNDQELKNLMLGIDPITKNIIKKEVLLYR